MEKCGWKLIPSDKFVLGQVADRCGDIADVVLLRPNRKTDLYLCEEHLNQFILNWGIHYQVQLLCPCAGDQWNKANGIDWDDIESEVQFDPEGLDRT